MHLKGILVGETKVNENEGISKEKWCSHFQSKQDGVGWFFLLLPDRHSCKSYKWNKGQPRISGRYVRERWSGLGLQDQSKTQQQDIFHFPIPTQKSYPDLAFLSPQSNRKWKGLCMTHEWHHSSRNLPPSRSQNTRAMQRGKKGLEDFIENVCKYELETSFQHHFHLHPTGCNFVPWF